MLNRVHLSVLALAISALAGEGVPYPVDRAATRLQEVEAKVSAGVIPRAQLAEAQEAFADAQDQNVVDALLSIKSPDVEVTPDQAREALAAALRRLDRRNRKVDEARRLVELGVAPRNSLLPVEEERDRDRRTVEITQTLLNELEQIAASARVEEAYLRQLQSGRAGHQPAAEKYEGKGVFQQRQLAGIEFAFEKQFEKPLPVSASGQTAVHRAMGFDHRGRVDVALTPDQPEGRWLLNYLQREKIPYFAFRSSIPGKATAAHIHIGPPSGPLRVSAMMKIAD